MNEGMHVGLYLEAVLLSSYPCNPFPQDQFQYRPFTNTCLSSGLLTLGVSSKISYTFCNRCSVFLLHQMYNSTSSGIIPGYEKEQKTIH
jgi:hypothetical protein